jgi:hypothetical protein
MGAIPATAMAMDMEVNKAMLLHSGRFSSTC